MNKVKTETKNSKFSIDLIQIVFKLFIKLIVFIIPKIDREKLIKIGKKKNTICIVEEKYEVLIKEPKQSLAKERFKHSCGQKKIDCFFGIKIEDIRFIGPCGIPITRKGEVTLKPISRCWINHAPKVTIVQLGLIGFIKEYCFAIFPIFDSKKFFTTIY